MDDKDTAQVIEKVDRSQPLSVRLSAYHKDKLRRFTDFLGHKSITDTIKKFIELLPDDFGGDSGKV